LQTIDSIEIAYSLVSESESDVFSDLVHLSGLRPNHDFRHSRLSGVDFAGSDLSEFNFDYADLRGARWENRFSDPSTLRYSLRGKGTDEVRGTDFDDLSAKVLAQSLWAERFFAFQVLVDNWGENLDTAKVLLDLLHTDNGTYLPLCSFVYFSASYLNDSDTKAWCVDMANAGGSQINLFRLKKLRRYVSEYRRYFGSVDIRPRYPEDLTSNEVKLIVRDVFDS